MNKFKSSIGTSENDKLPRATLDELVDQHFDHLLRYAYRHCNHREISEDLVQDTFLAASQAFDRFEWKSSPRTWLTSILRHKIIDRLRTKEREVSADIEASESDPMSKFFDDVEHWKTETGPLLWGGAPDEVLGQKQFFGILEKCLGNLPQNARQIFLLRELDGFERSEICEQLNLASSNVGVVLHRARIFLQQCLQQNWFKSREAKV